jgi:hypothetical protein
LLSLKFKQQVIFRSCVKERVSLFFSSNEEHVSVNQMWKIEKTPNLMERVPPGELSGTFNILQLE